MTAAFPGSVKSFGADRINGEIIPASDTNDVRAEIVAIETALIGGLVPDATASVKGILQLAGQLGGTAASPDVRGIRETSGPTLLTLGAIADGEFIKRSGTTLISGGLDETGYLINGSFNFAQRQAPATLTTITDKYAADRWRNTWETASIQYLRADGTVETGISSQYFGQYKKITAAGKIHVLQALEAANTLPLRGRTVTFQIKMKASAAKTIRMALISWIGTADAPSASAVSAWGANTVDPTLAANFSVITGAQSKSVTTSWQNFSITVTVPTTCKNLLCAFWTDSQFSINDILSVAEAGLFASSTVQSWLPRLAGEELLLCQRYFEKSQPQDTAPTTALAVGPIVGYVPVTGNKTSHSTLGFQTLKRAVPTMVLYAYNDGSSGNVSEYNTGGAWVANTGQGANPSDSGFFYFSAGTLTAGNTMRLHYTADAELM